MCGLPAQLERRRTHGVSEVWTRRGWAKDIMKRGNDLEAPTRRNQSGHAARRRTRKGGHPEQRGTSRLPSDGGSLAASRRTDATPADVPSPSTVAENKPAHENRDGAKGDAPNSGAPAADDTPPPPPEVPFSWTPTGVRFSLDGLTVDAEDLDRDRYGQKAIVTVRWGDLCCYRDRTNFDDSRRREKFVENVCRRAEAKLERDAASLIANRLNEDFLIQLGEECRTRPEERPTDPEMEKVQRAEAAAAAEQRARTLLDDPKILARVTEAIKANGYVGDPTPAKLAYVALTSRFLERPINLALVADSSAGKNLTIDMALMLVPREAVYMFSAGSPRSIIYTDEDFRNRIVVFKEADSIPSDAPAASAVRALAEDNELRYEVTTSDQRTGKFKTEVIRKQGPTGLITTSTRALRHQLSTRVLRVPMAADVNTTQEVIESKGRCAAGNAVSRPDLAPFLALQEWLSIVGEHRVIVPFGEELARLMPEAQDVRLRRDFDKVLSCVKTIALLHQCQRERTKNGEIVATIDDYAIARDLLESSFYAGADEICPPAIRETVEAVPRGEDQPVSEIDLAKRLGLPKQTISWRVLKALERGWLWNIGPRNRRPYRLRRGAAMPGDSPPLPEVHHVEGLFEGVPVPATMQDWLFGMFVGAIVSEFPGGVTVSEWAEAVKRKPAQVRERLDTLVAAQLLAHDQATDRYGVLFWFPIVTVARRASAER